MSQALPATGSAHNSASETEKSARPTASADARQAPSARAPKLRSCVVCRSRKVRCDKLSPCSNCRRANIACVFPSSDRPPRWARRFDRPVTGEVMERLHHLENLVKDLTGQLEQANAAAKSPTGASPTSVGSLTNDRDTVHQSVTASGVQQRFGRLVLQDASRSRYVGSGFWSRVNDELDDLRMATHGAAFDDSDSSDEEDESLGKTPSTQELDRSPSERHAFLFRHNLNPSSSDLGNFHPLPSQIPFLLEVYAENVNIIAHVVHMPTVTKMIRGLRGDMSGLTPANEALMFSIYYAAVTSMEEDDIVRNFGTTKFELNFKYRLGLEHALAKADFLHIPDLVLVQALAVFLLLVRRHDSPRFVWMMTGLLIRMGLALGLHRDGSNFQHLTPYEIEMRRRAWAALCMIDVRASEDQGTDYTIALGSYDTKMPLNINDADIGPDSKTMPAQREGLTEMSLPRIVLGNNELTKEMVLRASRTPNLEEQAQFVNELYERLEKEYLQYTADSSISYWVAVQSTRLVMAKMTLLVYLPILFSPPAEHLSDTIRNKLLVAAIEVAEYNHVLNSEQACRGWRWIFQTYTHWHAIIYILIEMSRRPWSPIVERAWTALHSVWLIPAQSRMSKNLRVWFPFRKLMAKAKGHRALELERLKRSPEAIERLVEEDSNIHPPSSPGLVPTEANAAAYYLHQWRNLVTASGELGSRTHLSAYPSTEGSDQLAISSGSLHNLDSTSRLNYQSTRTTREAFPSDQNPFNFNSAVTTSAPMTSGQAVEPIYTPFSTMPTGQNDGQPGDPNILPWLWSDESFANTALDPVDVNMDMDGSDVDWYNWVESAKGFELNEGPRDDTHRG
ncbi:uncharacterized protein N7459_000595 [Penicillium hispanicum]|uniref:uncharacterized protein n=1 Tax=Penicillium hispanicum TaxID=1080232 RepID=UPI00254251B2|nr:uncharacterized protein N7459_000595 [Penicillium hispanicum]KAJ5594387.1 hypothetical protein N7459_000595 [Penicillium hispanicum]